MRFSKEHTECWGPFFTPANSGVQGGQKQSHLEHTKLPPDSCSYRQEGYRGRWTFLPMMNTEVS